MKKILTFIGLALLFLGLMVWGIVSSVDMDDPATVAEPATQDEAPQVELEWTVIKSWEGEGIKTTESFETGGEWRINWESYGEAFEGAGLIQIYVTKDDGTLVTIAANVQGEGSDTSYVRSAGVHYLEIVSANTKWEVEVEDKR